MSDETTTSSHGYRYRAFISYSSKDAAAARKLHKRLETYRIPRDLVGRPGRDEPVPKRLFPIFRDRDELPLSADLGATIQDALRASRYLIVLCSPYAAQSRWVNEEVRYFKSLGREDRILAIILAGEPNASDHPDTAATECFPPALRYRVDNEGHLTDQRTEPIGGDLRRGGDGWTRVFLKAVAGVTGLGFDAFARRESKRRRRRRIAESAVALIAIVAGLWTWDYNRLKVAYYANVTTRWGVPEGVGPLDAATRAGREFHYRIESSRRKIRRVLRVNSVATLRDDPENHHAAIREVHYREDGSVQQIDLHDHNGKLVMRKQFSALRETNRGQVHFIEFKQEHQDAPLAFAASIGSLEIGIGKDQAQKSDITVHRIEYRPDGRVAQITYLNAYRVNRANADGIFGQRFLYADGPLPARIENLTLGGTPQPDANGLLAIELVYNHLGDRIARSYLGLSDQPILGSLQFASAAVTRDRLGNAIQHAYFGVDRKPVLDKYGRQKLTRTFDDRGNKIEEAYFGVDEEAVLHSEWGLHKVTLRFDERGNKIEEAYFGVDGKPVLDSEWGLHKLTRRFDERGNEIEEAYFGVDEEAVLHSERGFHKLTRRFDERGNLIEQTSFGVDGKPTPNVNGYHKLTNVFDERGNLIEQTYFGGDGSPTFHDGYHKVTQAFDERGKMTEQTYFGVDGTPTLNTDGYHKYTNTFDERGNRIEQTYFGVDGMPVPSRYAVHQLMQAFDERGNEIEESYFGVDGEPTPYHGYHRIARAYDKRGNLIALSYFGVDGTPTLNTDGYHKFTNVFDERGNITEQTYFGVDGKPTLSANGFHKLTQAFDERGNMIEHGFFGVDGELLWRVVHSYDEMGAQTDVWYGPDGVRIPDS